jgi:hypothetical protein
MAYQRKKQKKLDYIKNPLDYSEIKLKTEDLDEWQKEVFDYWGNIGIRAGRQVGKSFAMAKKAAQAVLKFPGIKILITASSERQAMYLYEKVQIELAFATTQDIYSENPTMRKTRLKNGSEIYCLPVGQNADLIRGLTIDVWIPDEAAFINRQVYMTITPMLWISKKEKGMGWIWALSTPFGKEGFFYEIFQDDSFKTWHISSLDCDRIPKDTLEKWRLTFTRVEYAQEVLGDFIEEVSRLFSEELLNNCWTKEIDLNNCYNKILGVDVARFGIDLNAFVSSTENGKKIKIYHGEVTERKSIYETYTKINMLDEKEHYKKIIVDEGGVGGGLVDFLIRKYKDKIIGINNAKRSEKIKKGIIKEDLYSHAVVLMESGKVEILDNAELFNSLRSVQYEIKDGKINIFTRNGNNHLAEAFVRAIWPQGKNLNSFVIGF